ncbi:MAG: sulfite exporter TauE/SafE family protein [Oligoflexia bacterium]|jgi:uncharacterized membrane protein YfcA
MWLLLAGLMAGLMDSIAGGGGLITLPTLLLHVGPGAHAIGSNKIPGFIAAFTALVVYARKGHLDWRGGIAFSVACAVGAFGGSQASPHIPPEFFRYLLAATVPLILGFVFFGNLLRRKLAHEHIAPQFGRIITTGLVVGFYDGAWGPGGGTFMLLGLMGVAGMGLLPAIATSKLANSFSALFSGIGYWSAGLVRVEAGVAVAAGAVIGATIGARMASARAERVARPALVAVAMLLLWRVWAM